MGANHSRPYSPASAGVSKQSRRFVQWYDPSVLESQYKRHHLVSRGNDVWKPDLYADMFKSLITDWRNKWRKKEMPFLYVQISLIPGPEMFGDESVQQTFRKKQQISLANTGMVYSLDIGDPYDVHPRNKKVIGERLAEQAFRTAYK